MLTHGEIFFELVVIVQVGHTDVETHKYFLKTSLLILELST